MTTPELIEALAAKLGVLGYEPRVIGHAEIGAQESPERLDGLILVASAADDAAIKNAFRLLRLAAPGLRRAGKDGGAVFATVTRLGGSFGVGRFTAEAEPVAGALAGLAKTAGHEWPEVHCKAIDLDPSLDDPDEAAGAIVEELFRRGPAEVGLAADGGTTLEP